MAGNIDERRIVLVGKTGNGKSATANTILGKKEFYSKISAVSVTKYCEKKETKVRDRKVVVVDTPGFFDTGRPKEETSKEVSRCVTLCSPGPHVILQVIRLCCFTQEEEQVAELIRQIFTLKAKNYMIILFTRKEDLGKKPLKEFICEGNSMLKEQVAQCGNRYLAFNNNAEGKEREAQVDQLMTMIDDLVKKNEDNPCYTEEMMKEDKEILKKMFSWLCHLL